MADAFEELRERVIAFRDARDWEQFHTWKDLAAGLQIEAAELAELFLWKSDSEVTAALQDAETREALADELADVQTYLLYLAHAARIDLAEAVRAKVAKNEAKYPVEKARGNARKYDRLDEL